MTHIGHLCVALQSSEQTKKYWWRGIFTTLAPHLVEFSLRPMTLVGENARSHHPIVAVECTIKDQRKTLHLMFAQKNSPKAIQIEFTPQKQCILVDHSHKDSKTSRPMLTMVHIRRNPILHGYVAQFVLLSMVPNSTISC